MERRLNQWPSKPGDKAPRNLTIWGLIMLYAVATILPTIGLVNLFDWDEINFAESAREMVLTGDYLIVQIGFKPFWEKPPLFIWMQAASMHLFGINEFAARFPNLVASIATLFILYQIGKRIQDWKLGILWSTFFACSILPAFYFHTGIIDPWFNLFTFLAFVSLHFGAEHKAHYIAAGLFLGLAILTKGPVAALISLLALIVRIAMGWRPAKPEITGLLMLTGMATLVGGSWFALLCLYGQSHLIGEFIAYQIRLFTTPDAGHGGTILYHPTVLLIGCFPAAIPAVGSLFRRDNQPNRFTLWMKILFWVPLILFSLVTTKIIHYSSLCYFPLTYLAADYIRNKEWKKYQTTLLLIVGTLIGICLTIIPLVLALAETVDLTSFIRDPFTQQILSMNVWWTGLECMTGSVLLISLESAYQDIRKQQVQRGMGKILIGTLATLILCLITIIPNIEWHLQRSALHFYKDHAHEKAYIRTLGFKSYADLFYSKTRPENNSRQHPAEWYLTGDIDKPVYFVTKVTFRNRIKQKYPQLRKIGEEGGYDFYLRRLEQSTSRIASPPTEPIKIEKKQPKRLNHKLQNDGN